jgi:hypothetical protein
MTIKYERQYGVIATCNFVLWETDGVDVNATASSVLGDVTLSLDFAACANSTNLFSAHASGMGHQIVLTSAEMRAERVFVRIVDQDSTKEWLDEILLIETYGDENSQHNLRESGVILNTEIASVTDNSNFVIVDKPNDNDTLLNSVAMIIDHSNEGSPADRSFRDVINYTGATGAVQLDTDTDFTIAAGDRVVFLPTANVESANEIASAVWDISRGDHTTDGTYGQGIIVNHFTASARGEVSANMVSALTDLNILDTDDLPTNFGSFAITGAGAVTVGTNNDKTDYYLAASANQEVAAQVLLYEWASAIEENSEPAATARNTLQALRAIRNKWGITDGNPDVFTVYREDDTTTAWQANLTSIASANAITGSDPDD